jgi:hypothetical protein
VRALSCMQNGGQVGYTGSRVDLARRLPREERMKAYRQIEWKRMPAERCMDYFGDAVPVAVEMLKGSELLTSFDHPENAVYVFGPEDGSLPKGIRLRCHRFVTIPAYHCLNLAAAVYFVLYDRVVKAHAGGTAELPILAEERGWWHSYEAELQATEVRR